MSDYRTRSYARNSTISSENKEGVGQSVVKKVVFPSFLPEQDQHQSSLYTESQGSMLKNWVDESRFINRGEISERLKEISKNSGMTGNVSQASRRLLDKEGKEDKGGHTYKKPNKDFEGFVRRGDLPQLEKVAKFLMVLPKDKVAKIFKYLDRKEVESIIRQMVHTSPPSNPVEIYELQQEFKYLAEKTKIRTMGGLGTARRILEKSIGKDQVDKILNKVEKSSHIPFDFLRDLGDKDIWDVIKGESSSIQAIILNFLNRSQAKFVVNKLSPEKQKDLLLRLGRMKKVHTDILESLEDRIYEKVEEHRFERGGRLEGKEVLSQILQYMDPSAEEKLIKSLDLEEKQKEELDDLLFSIEVVLRIQDEDIHNILKEYSAGEITLLIRGKDLEVKHKILSNLSKRRQEEVEDEGCVIGRVHMKEIDLVTRRFLNDLKRRQESREITIFRKNEEYVQ